MEKSWETRLGFVSSFSKLLYFVSLKSVIFCKFFNNIFSYSLVLAFCLETFQLKIENSIWCIFVLKHSFLKFLVTCNSNTNLPLNLIALSSEFLFRKRFDHWCIFSFISLFFLLLVQINNFFFFHNWIGYTVYKLTFITKWFKTWQVILILQCFDHWYTFPMILLNLCKFTK